MNNRDWRIKYIISEREMRRGDKLVEFNTPTVPERYRAVAIHVEKPETTVDRFNDDAPFRKEAFVVYFSKSVLTTEQTDIGLLREGGLILFVSHTIISWDCRR